MELTKRYELILDEPGEIFFDATGASNVAVGAKYTRVWNVDTQKKIVVGKSPASHARAFGTRRCVLGDPLRIIDLRTGETLRVLDAANAELAAMRADDAFAAAIVGDELVVWSAQGDTRSTASAGTRASELATISADGLITPWSVTP